MCKAKNSNETSVLREHTDSLPTTEPTKHHYVRGIHDLVPYEDFEDPQAAYDAAQNVRLPLLAGIKAIGELIADGTESKIGHLIDPEGSTLFNVGYLLTEIAEIVDHLNDVIDNAGAQMRSRP